MRDVQCIFHGMKQVADARTGDTLRGGLTQVRGLAVGHCTDADAATGCTVVLCGEGAVGGVSVRGAAPGTRETDLLDPVNVIQQIHAVLLTGGSAFGLDAAGGVMRWLEEHELGCEVGRCRVPLVSAAVLFDLLVGRSDVRPGPDDGYAACRAASSDPVLEGSIGAGTGASVGKLFGFASATKGGVGSDAVRLGSGTIVGALAVVNAFGNVTDPTTGQTLGGARDEGGGFVDMTAWLTAHDDEVAVPGQVPRASWPERGAPGGAGASAPPPPGASTTLVVVGTDAILDKAGATAVAAMAHDGIARAVDPCHTQRDGDTVFALATGAAGRGADVSVLGAAAARVVASSIVRAVHAATSLAGVPALRDLS
jgi:L-aminopeptidase/D-esterase-like protein